MIWKVKKKKKGRVVIRIFSVTSLPVETNVSKLGVFFCYTNRQKRSRMLALMLSFENTLFQIISRYFDYSDNCSVNLVFQKTI